MPDSPNNPNETRHCEARSAVAIQKGCGCESMDCFAFGSQ
jgi:hypothetical protein